MCRTCDARLARTPDGRCVHCQERGPGEAGLCTPCREAGSPLEACIAAAWFRDEAADFVRRFKYAGRGLKGLDPCGEIVATALVREALRRLPGPAPDAVVPVPVHRRRVRRRGFHAAGLLARAAARDAGVRCAPELLHCTRDTPSQTGMAPDARRRNVARAFAARRLEGARIWLVDDVVTTGATLGEAARTLRAAGAVSVSAACAARTPRLEGPMANG